MSFRCSRCEKSFETYPEKVQHEEKAVNHWKCQRVSKGDKHCSYVGSSFGSLVHHWESTKCHLFCEQCKAGWMTPTELFTHCESNKHKATKRAADIQRGLIDDPSAAISKQPKAKKKKPKKTLSALLPQTPQRPVAPARLADKPMSREAVISVQPTRSLHPDTSSRFGPPVKNLTLRSGPPPRSTQSISTGLRSGSTTPAAQQNILRPRNTTSTAASASTSRFANVSNAREVHMTGDGPAKKQAWTVEQIREAQRAQERFLPKLEASQKARAPTIKIAGPVIQEPAPRPRPPVVVAKENERPTSSKRASYLEAEQGVYSPATPSARSLLDDDPTDTGFASPMPVLSPIKSPMTRSSSTAQSVVSNVVTRAPSQEKLSRPLYFPPATKAADATLSLGSSQYAVAASNGTAMKKPSGGGLGSSRWATPEETHPAPSFQHLAPTMSGPQDALVESKWSTPASDPQALAIQTPAIQSQAPHLSAGPTASTTRIQSHTINPFAFNQAQTPSVNNNMRAFQRNAFAVPDSSPLAAASVGFYGESSWGLPVAQRSASTGERISGLDDALKRGGGIMASKYAS